MILYFKRKEQLSIYHRILVNPKSLQSVNTYRLHYLLSAWINMNNVFFSFSMCWGDRLIKEGYCDRGSAPSVSAISRLVRGHDGDDTSSEKKISDGKSDKNTVILRPSRSNPNPAFEEAFIDGRVLLIETFIWLYEVGT